MSRFVLELAAVQAFSGLTLGQDGSNPMGANSNGSPGVWLPPVAHGTHPIGCVDPQTQQPDSTQFYPIHAALIPKGAFRGCVLLWEKGHQGLCRTYTQAPNASIPSTFSADAEQRWAIFDPRTSPPTIYKFAWRIRTIDAAFPPCTDPNAAATQVISGHQGMFCAGHCWLPDGRLLVAGGDYWFHGICMLGGGFAGSRMLAVFDPDLVSVNFGAHPALQATNGPAVGSPWISFATNTAPGGGANALPLRAPRWYPTVTVMAPASLSPNNPNVYVSVSGGVEMYPTASPLSGDPSFNTHELFRFNYLTSAITRDPRTGSVPIPNSNPLAFYTGLFTGPSTPQAGGLSLYYYPRMHFMSARQGSQDGRVVMTGMAIQSADADIINFPEAWNNGPVIWSTNPSNDTMVEEPTVVLFPAIDPTYRDIQMVIGGMRTTAFHGGSQTILNEVSFHNTKPGSVSWVPGPPMIHPRKFANAVILPDASVVVVGGGTESGHGSTGGGQFAAEMFANGQWQELADQFAERTYHSIALLLPDGTILSAGGDSHLETAEYEIFIPPYLQGNPARPTFTTTATQPSVLHYGANATFIVSAPFGQSIERVVLLAPGSVTHSQDPNQRYQPLAFEVDDTGPLEVTAPANATECPPGFYMMFLVSSAGVPSVAHWVQLLP